MLSEVTEAFDVIGKTAVISNFIINILIAGPLNLLWGTINCLQIITSLPLINVLMPANCQLLFSVLVKIATFDLIPVDGVMDEIDRMMPTEDSHIEIPDNFR